MLRPSSSNCVIRKEYGLFQVHLLVLAVVSLDLRYRAKGLLTHDLNVEPALVHRFDLALDRDARGEGLAQHGQGGRILRCARVTAAGLAQPGCATKDPVTERCHQHLQYVARMYGQLALAFALLAVQHSLGADAEVEENAVLADGDDLAFGHFAHLDAGGGLERGVQHVGETFFPFWGRGMALIVCHGLSLSVSRFMWITKILAIV